MAVVGFFQNPAEMLKLSQSKLLAGVVPEIYEEGQLIGKLPVTLIDSYKLIWNREKTLPTATPKSLSEQYSWKSVADLTRVELELEEYGDQWLLDKFVQDTYKDPNDYRAVVMKMIVKGCLRSIEDDLIYGNHTTHPKEFNGLDKLCPATGGHSFAAGNQDHDAVDAVNTAGALSVANLRDCIDMVKPKPDLLLMTRMCRNKLSAAAFEAGVSANATGRITYDKNQYGTRIEYFDNIPILISDYLTYENTNTGGKASSGNLRSIYAIRLGEVEDGGVSLCVGGGTGGANFFNETPFDKLEFQNAEGIRMYAFVSLAMGSTKSVARIHSLDQTAAVIA